MANTVQMRMITAMTCKREHGDWFLETFIKPDGSKKECCTYIMGYKMIGDSGTNVIMCCDLKVGDKLPETYLPLTENES